MQFLKSENRCCEWEEHREKLALSRALLEPGAKHKTSSPRRSGHENHPGRIETSRTREASLQCAWLFAARHRGRSVADILYGWRTAMSRAMEDLLKAARGASMLCRSLLAVREGPTDKLISEIADFCDQA